MIFGFPIISVAIWLPVIFGILVLATGGDRNASLARAIALVGATLGFWRQSRCTPALTG